MTGNTAKPRIRLHRNVWVLTFTSFLTDVSSEMIFNLLPLFLFNVLGVRTSVIGLIDGVAETTASLLKLYSGALADRLGRYKRLAVVGYGVSAAAKPFLYLANSWGWVLGVRFSDRVGKGIRNAPRDALLAGSVDPSQRGLAFGLHRAGDTAGAFLGMSIAALIVWMTQSGSAQLTRPTFQAIVIASIIPAFLGLLTLALGAKEISTPRPDGALLRFCWTGLDRRFRAFLISIILFTLGNSSDAFIILRGQERGLSVFEIMFMLLTFNAVYALLSGPAGSLSDRIGRRSLVLAGWLIYGFIYLGFAIAQTGSQVWFLFALYGVYYAFTEGTARALIADLVPQENRGRAYGLFHASIGLTALPASMIAGILWQGLGAWSGFGPAAPFQFGALMAISSSLLFYFTVRERKSPI